MRITFFTNFINHHQVPLADELYKILGDQYKLVSFEPIPDEFLKRGYYDFSDKPYHIKGYLCKNSELVKYLARESDVLLHGAAPEEWVAYRLTFNKTTIRYGERLIKLVDSSLLNPKYWKTKIDLHTKYRNAQLFMLGASGYNRFDSNIIFAYPNKVYRWGYFTKMNDIDIDEVLVNKRGELVNILWVGTISDVKRPDLVPKLASQLKRSNYNFHIDMIGSGVLEPKIRNLIDKLNVSDCISMLGNVPNDNVLQRMQDCNIFIFTSHYGEGWGAVINEAMSNGCAVVCSKAVGAAPFLIKNNYNGLLFKSGSSKDLFQKVSTFIENADFREQCAKNAYITMRDVWSPKVAAKNFIQLCHDLITGSQSNIPYGPCSIAPLILPNLNPFPFMKKIIRRIFTGKSLSSI